MPGLSIGFNERFTILNTENPTTGATDELRSTFERVPLGWLGWLLILSVAMVVCCFNLGGARTLTEHEIYAAGGAKQMALDHDWLFPKIGDHLWLEKPPLLHWLIIAAAKLFGGFSEAAARFPSAIAGVGIVIVMTLLSARWFGRRVAMFTALVQTTSVYFITYARLAEAEMILACIVVLALFVFARLQRIGAGWPTAKPHLTILFWALVGLSNMAKGLGFGAALILVPCVGYLIWRHDPASWRRMISWPGITLGVGLAIWWPIVVAWQEHQVGQLWLTEITKRAFGAPQYEQPWWYYLQTVPWQLLPWTPALLLGGRASLARARHDASSPDRFIWCWSILPIAVLSLFRGKHHHYIISCLCAFSPICALGLLKCGMRVAVACAAVAVTGTLIVHGWIMSRFDRSRDDCEFLKSVRNYVGPQTPLAAVGGREIARHIFYVDPPPQGIWDPASLEQHFRSFPLYVIGRAEEQARLSKLGQVEVIAQSRHTRAEQGPSDRFTLFRIQPGTP